MIRKCLAILFVCGFLLIVQQNAFACSCEGKSTAADEFERSALVIIGRVVSVEPIDRAKLPPDLAKRIFDDAGGRNGSRPLDEYEKYKSAKIVVEKVYKGGVKVGDELIFAQGSGSDCRWTFDSSSIGNRNLLYLDPPRKEYFPFYEDEQEELPKYSAIVCGRSGDADTAFEDLLYLDKIEKVRGKSRVSGRLYGDDDAPNFAGASVKITGKDKTFQLKTDKNGVFEIYDLPAGEYIAEIRKPHGWKIGVNYINSDGSEILVEKTQTGTKYRVSFTLRENGHVGLPLFYEIDNAVSGKVLSPTGKTLKGVCVTLITADRGETLRPGKYNCTNESGVFRIETIPTGAYLLVINETGKMSGEKTFGTLFYPGVTERKAASVVHAAPNKFLNDIDIQISKMIELIEISGRFSYEDGTPAARESVIFEPEDSKLYEKITVTTDTDGRFALKIPNAASGNLYGEEYFYKTYTEKCEKLKEILGEGDSRTIKTSEVKIGADENYSDIKLIFPFPFCSKTDQ